MPQFIQFALRGPPTGGVTEYRAEWMPITEQRLAALD
jgi:hypothetical protein